MILMSSRRICVSSSRPKGRVRRRLGPWWVICPISITCETTSCNPRSLLQNMRLRDIPRITLIKGSEIYENAQDIVLHVKLLIMQTMNGFYKRGIDIPESISILQSILKLVRVYGSTEFFQMQSWMECIAFMLLLLHLQSTGTMVLGGFMKEVLKR